MMKIKETFSQGLKRTYEISYPTKDIEMKLNARLENIGKRVKFPGFRPGKVPLTLLKQRYNTEALSEVIEDCVEKGVQQAVKDNSLKPALKPKVNLNSFEEGKDLTFIVEMEVLPTLEDIKLDNLAFEKYVVTVPPEAITGVLENLARQTRKTSPIQKQRKTKKGDIVIIDFEGFVDNKPIEGGSGKDHALELGSGSFIPGFEEQLINQDKNAHVEVKVTFPKEYHESKYADKPARFDVTITDIHEADPFEIDTALAKKLGFETLEDMQKWVEQSISKDYTAKSFLNTKRHVLDALAERFPFEVPQNMTDLEFDNIWEQLCRELGIDQSKAANANVKDKTGSKTFEEAAGKSEEELRKEYKMIAERRVRLGILLAEIGTRNNIVVTNQELINALTARAREFPGQENEVFDFYRNNESALATLRAPIFENKVVEFILDKAKITEKSITPEKLDELLVAEEEEAEKKISLDAKKAKKPSKKTDA
ncbi:MAG TPA: trigger factor [Alphaproteobacteria bacterium]|nr:trigger factor [Alphaproteobacteria bacterium]